MKRETKTACVFGAAMAFSAILMPMTLSRDVHASDLGIQDSNGIIRSDLGSKRLAGILLDRSNLNEILSPADSPITLTEGLASLADPFTLNSTLSLADGLLKPFSLTDSLTQIWKLDSSLNLAQGLASALADDGS